MTEPIDVAQRLAALLEGGRRVATYKLATLLALMDACAEAEVPPRPGEPFRVSILNLADRVIELYWPQVRDYGDRVLRQSTQSKAIIVDVVHELYPLATSAAAVRAEHPRRYDKARTRVAHTLAKQPLPALQTPGGRSTPRTPFLYDDSWLSYDITRSELERRGWELVLLPGVADVLVRLSGLLRPVIERAWTDDIARLNHLDREYQDLPLFLFGAERSSLVRAAVALREIEGSRCFYCQATLAKASAHVDHFLPWSRVPLNGLANLVLADARCNLDKSDSLASRDHLAQWQERDRASLEVVGNSLHWPAEWDRSHRLARGLYSRLPPASPLWRAVGVDDLAP